MSLMAQHVAYTMLSELLDSVEKMVFDGMLAQSCGVTKFGCPEVQNLAYIGSYAFFCRVKA